MELIVVATASEYRMAQERFRNRSILLTGIGALNVIRSMKDLMKSTSILNFGYAGSNVLSVGTEVNISRCELLHENCDYESPVYRLSGDVPCYTSSDFVTKTKIKEPCVFDMELAFILALGFKRVESIKIVSDNLSVMQYIEKVKKGEKSYVRKS